MLNISIKEAIKICDSRKAEGFYKWKFKYLDDSIGGKARNSILIEKIATFMIKYIYGYNNYGL